MQNTWQKKKTIIGNYTTEKEQNINDTPKTSEICYLRNVKMAFLLQILQPADEVISLSPLFPPKSCLFYCPAIETPKILMLSGLVILQKAKDGEP